MPRAGQVKPPTDERLSDRIAIGLLTRTFTPAAIDAAVASTDRGEVRSRLLPARVTVYYVLAMCLFAGQGYEEVMRLLVGGLEWLGRWRRTWTVPSTAAIAKARARLGAEPLRSLFSATVRPLATDVTRGAWYRGLRLVAIDGATLDVPDTAENDEQFGRPGSGRGEGKGAFPQVRLVGLAECGTHAVFAAALGSYSTAERTLAIEVLGSLRPGMLMLADRGFTSYELWQAAAATGADVLWRASGVLTLPVLQVLADGSYLSRLVPGKGTRPHRNSAEPVTVRVIEYTIDDGRAPENQHYRLITTVLDPAQAPAEELAELYAERWEFENTLDELKTHQRGAKVVLRSRFPDGVEQEVWGFLLVHWAIRELMHAAALDGDVDPDRVSFMRTLRLVRRTVTEQAAFSP
jgi:Insertion element 4 transposase N-terminal/Transposase DDE domain